MLNRHIYSHYYYSGLTAATGVVGIAVIAFLLGGFPLASAMAMGAMCTSISDQPTPSQHKFAELAIGLLVSTLIAATVSINKHDQLALGITVVSVSFVAAFVTAYGRKAMPLSFAMAFAIILSISLKEPLLSPADFVKYFFFGGSAYLLFSVAISRFLDFKTRQQTLAEFVLELAKFIYSQASFLETNVALPEAYQNVIKQQIMMAEKAQIARDMIFRKRHNPKDAMLVNTLAATLDTFEQLLSTHTDFNILREHYPNTDLLMFFRDAFRKAARDVEQIGDDLMKGQISARHVNYKAELLAIEHEISVLRQPGASNKAGHPAQIRSYDKLLQLIDQIDHLRNCAQTPVDPRSVLKGVAVTHFISHPSYSPRLLLSHISFHSGVFLYALRVSSAMACGYWLALILPYAAHGQWILLTIVVIMRGSFSLTRQRQRDRVIGSIEGCLLAATILWITQDPVVVTIIAFIAISIAHSYVTVNYRNAVIAASVMGLLPMHFLEAGAHPFLIVERIIDTGVGTVVAWLFSYFLPSWESRNIPALIRSVMRTSEQFAKTTLDCSSTVHNYRLHRKHMLDSVAALAAATRRMLTEPNPQHLPIDPLNRFISDSFLMTARLAAIHLLLTNRQTELDEALTRRTTADAENIVSQLLSQSSTVENPPQELIRNNHLPDGDELAVQRNATHIAQNELAIRLKNLTLTAGSMATSAQSLINNYSSKP